MNAAVTSVAYADPPTLVVDDRRTRGPYARLVKPIVDRTIAAVAVIVLSPLIAAVAVAVRRRLGSPVLYRQERIGLGDEPFTILKFRTMQEDRRLNNRPFDGPDRRRTHKTDEDPRLVPLGRTLRRLSLDELPQLWNVVRGDMSIVGPRPELASVVEQQYEPWQHQRHLVRPGITGLWQISGRREGRLMYEDTVLDLEYIERMSAKTDLHIILKTPLAAVRPVEPALEAISDHDHDRTDNTNRVRDHAI